MLNTTENLINGTAKKDSAVNCTLTSTPTSISITAKDIQGEVLSIVGFNAQTQSTEVGMEMMKSALIAWMLGKFRQSQVLNLQFALDPRSHIFLEDLSTDILAQLDDSAQTRITGANGQQIETVPVSPIENQVWIGSSGGRDSFVSASILRDCGYDLHDYSISYDRKNPHKDFSTHEQNSRRMQDNQRYEPFDIPVTYLAPLWSVRDTAPQHLAVGHSFDVLGYESSNRKAPYESPDAMRIHQKYMDSMLGKSVQLTFPIATLSTHGVFEYIRRNHGISELESRVSCWNDEDSDCGYCDKCQRIKLASSAVHEPKYGYLSEMPQVVESHSYLFGNPAYDNLVARYGSDYLADCQLFSENLPINHRIIDHLRRTFTKSYTVIETNGDPQSFSFNGDQIDIASKIGIDYDKLRSEPMHDSMALLPYEQYSERQTPVLASYGEMPQFNEKTGWSYMRVSEGPRLEVPDTPLFRRFFRHENE